MVRDNKRYMVSHTTNNNNKNNNLIMPTQWLTQPSFSRHISIPQEQREKLATSSSKRPRGRSPRSNNNPKSPVVIEKITESPMKMILIEIPVGKDIVGALINLAQRHQSCLTVLRGSGLVTNFSFLQSESRALVSPMEGLFHMISLSGTYINASCGRVPPRFITNQTTPSFCIYLSGGDGHVFGGIVGGRIKAASVVLITAILLRKPKFHRLVNIDGNDFEIEERVTPNSNNNNNNNNNNVINVPGFNVTRADLDSLQSGNHAVRVLLIFRSRSDGKN